jgi:hypothetical protein
MEKCCSMNDAERAVLADAAHKTLLSRCKPEALVAERLDYYRQLADQGCSYTGNPFLKSLMEGLQSDGPRKVNWLLKLVRRLC